VRRNRDGDSDAQERVLEQPVEAIATNPPLTAFAAPFVKFCQRGRLLTPSGKLIFTHFFGLWALGGHGGRASGENFSQHAEMS
jgi:hypothetical protein